MAVYCYHIGIAIGILSSIISICYTLTLISFAVLHTPNFELFFDFVQTSDFIMIDSFIYLSCMCLLMTSLSYTVIMYDWRSSIAISAIIICVTCNVYVIISHTKSIYNKQMDRFIAEIMMSKNKFTNMEAAAHQSLIRHPNPDVSDKETSALLSVTPFAAASTSNTAVDTRNNKVK